MVTVGAGQLSYRGGVPGVGLRPRSDVTFPLVGHRNGVDDVVLVTAVQAPQALVGDVADPGENLSPTKSKTAKTRSV